MALTDSTIEHSTPDELVAVLKRELFNKLEVIEGDRSTAWARYLTVGDSFSLPGTGVMVRNPASEADLLEKMLVQLINTSWMYQETRF